MTKKNDTDGQPRSGAATCSAPWSFVNHTWAESTVYDAHDRPVCSFSIREEATEETQEVLERRMDAHVRLVTAAPDLLAALQSGLAVGQIVGGSKALAHDAIEKALGIPAQNAKAVLMPLPPMPSESSEGGILRAAAAQLSPEDLHEKA